jgi:glycosyltransferase involved in cell wall biosynthesis
MARLILLTMVKNESRIIERLLNSVLGKVDGVVICDTGSTDNTIALAEAWIAKHIPGKVFEYPFKNFGASRTESFLRAQEWVASQGWDPVSTWALLLDGDMMMTDPISKTDLDRETAWPNVAGLSLKQANGDMIYSNVRVLRCSEPWICKGGTHEAWTSPPNRSVTLLSEPILRDHGDGGCKADKYPRDIRLLLEDIAAMPNDARSHFYLGQTYICMRDWPKAIETLKKRIIVGGWDEETYFAKVYLGEAYEHIGDKAAAAFTWLEAWHSRKHRTEALIKLITMYRNEPHSQEIAHMYLEKLWTCQTGRRLDGTEVAEPLKNNDLLFVSRKDMAVHFWEELAILSYYCGAAAKRSARDLIDQYDLSHKLNWHEFNAIFGHLKWYDTVLDVKKTRFIIPLSALPWASEEHAAVWQPFNPSIRRDGDGYLLNLRYANYWTEEAKHYHYRGFHGKVLTRNCLLRFGPTSGWNAPDSLEEIVIDPSIKQSDGYIQGVEDCRLIQGSDRVEFLGTSRSYSSNGTNKIMHVWQDDGKWLLREMPLPSGVSADETQKNWMGFRVGGELQYLYGYSPMRVCAEDGSDVGKQKEPLFKLREYRGSAGPVEWSSAANPDERYLTVIHKVYIGGEGRRYYHRFLTLNADFSPSRVSSFVRMTQERVEYWSGMCCSPNGYYVTYGLKDSEAYIAEVSKELIEGVILGR